MKKNNLQAGLAPLAILLIVVVAAAIGGGAYYSTKDKTPDGNDDSASESAEEEANIETESSSKTSLRALLALGQDVKCTFSQTSDGTQSSGTVFIADGMMRGDFDSRASAGMMESHMITRDEMTHVWSGSQGTKIDVGGAQVNSQTEASGTVDLDSEVAYECEDWNKDETKFTVPASVNFLDVGTMMQGQGSVRVNIPNLPAGVDVEGVIDLDAGVR